MGYNPPRNWTAAQLKILNGNLPHPQAAKELGVHTDVVRRARKKVNTGPTAVAGKTELERREQVDVLQELRELRLKSDVITRFEQNLAKTAPKSYKTEGKAPVLKKIATKALESQVLLLSDLHCGQEVCEEETMKLGRYDMDVFCDRMALLRDKIVHFVKAGIVPAADELVVVLNGDLIDGALSHGAEADQQNTITEQFVVCAHAIARLLQSLAHVYPKVRVYSAPGNHGRFPHQKKTPDKHLYSSLDTMVGMQAQALTKDIKNVEWHIDRAIQQKFKVKGWTFLALHGHTLRGGDKALGLPSHAIARQISAACAIACKTKTEVPNYILVGHFHRSTVIPHTNGEIYMNGAFVGTDTYALSSSFQLCEPSQWFLSVHPEIGVTIPLPIRLAAAVPGSGKEFKVGF